MKSDTPFILPSKADAIRPQRCLKDLVALLFSKFVGTMLVALIAQCIPLDFPI
jgi:hypothetical protein